MATQDSLRLRASFASPLSAALALPGRLAALIAAAHDRWLQRRALEAMDDHLLRDIGLSRHDALREAAKPFWRV